jgi:hypothetical protein
MKNAYVLEHHLGDDGTVTEGMILTDITEKRFDALKKRGLVREATAEEVKAGYQPKIAADESAGLDHDRVLGLSHAQRVAAEAQTYIEQLVEEHAEALRAETERANAAESALAVAQGERDTLTASLTASDAALAEARKETAEMKTANEAAEKALGDARAEIAELQSAAKQDKAPANKKAADPANKGA